MKHRHIPYIGVLLVAAVPLVAQTTTTTCREQLGTVQCETRPKRSIGDALTELGKRSGDRARQRRLLDLYAPRAQMIISDIADSLLLAGDIRDDFRQESAVILANLFAAVPEASNAQMRDAISPVTASFGRESANFLTIAQAAIRRVTDSLATADSVAFRTFKLQEGTDSLIAAFRSRQRLTPEESRAMLIRVGRRPDA